MPSPIRIFIATDDHSEAPERVIEYSIRKNTNAEVDITFMRAGDPGYSYDEWNRGVPKDEWRPKSGGGWGTAFSVFRFTVPERCHYEGKAIYMDSDIIVLGDVQELWDMALPKPWVSKSMKRTCVSVIDCAGMKGVIPPITQMQTTGKGTSYYRMMLVRDRVISPTLPNAWNSADSCPPGTKALHFTNMGTQPWKPWPDKIKYSEHPDLMARSTWEHYEEESRVG